MRFISTISFISLLVLFMELVALPFFLRAGEKPSVQVAIKSQTCCAKKAATGTCMKTNDAGKDGPECCVNCPLFYVMIAPQYTPTEVAGITIERFYPDHNADYLFSHFSSAWKPPNES